MSDPAARTEPLGKGPLRLALAMTALTIVLISLGAMVTSTATGLSIRDWPLSNGSLVPTGMTDDQLFEGVHRIVGAAVGLCMLILTVWVHVRPAAGFHRVLCIAGLVTVIVQGVIGGVGVLQNLPVWNSTAHGVLAQLTLALFAAIGFLLSPGWADRLELDAAARTSARRWSVIVVAALVVQTLIGALGRHSNSPHAIWTHVVNAAFVFLLVIIGSAIVGGRSRGHAPLARIGRWMIGLLALQLALGLVALLVRTGKHPENIRVLWRAGLISAHVLVGALLTLGAALQAVVLFRATRAQDRA